MTQLRRRAMAVAVALGVAANCAWAGLIGYWPMDEGAGPTAFDASANSNDGAITGASWTAAGKLGNALSFDGSGDWVNCGTDASLNLGTGNFTYSLWFKGPGVGGWRWLLNQNGDGWAGNSVFLTTNPVVRVSVGSWFTDVISGATTTVADDEWNHLVLTRSGTAIRAYLNGVQEGNTGASAASIGITRPLYIGRGPSPAGTDVFSGIIDDAALFDHAITAAEVAYLYNDGAGLSASALPEPTTLSLLALGGLGFWRRRRRKR